MPELPEVETVLSGLKPHLEGAVIQEVVVRQAQLRWPVPRHLNDHLMKQTIGHMSRRGKYLLIPISNKGTLIVHLGMSGSLQIVTKTTLPKHHDHLDLVFSATHLLRYTDPRRFGAVLWTDAKPDTHPLLKSLGPEPLSADFTAQYFLHAAKNRRIAIKSFIMDSHVVVGIGNIYAAEALHLAKIHPETPAGSLDEAACVHLVESIQQILRLAIKQGGTTVKDFLNSEGKPGYFVQELQVYGRAGLACKCCKTLLQSMKLAQRSTVFCPNCQSL